MDHKWALISFRWFEIKVVFFFSNAPLNSFEIGESVDSNDLSVKINGKRRLDGERGGFKENCYFVRTEFQFI